MACKALATMSARGGGSGSSKHDVHLYSGNSSSTIDIAHIEQEHLKEHGTIGLNIELTVEELDRLHLVLQAPSGGLVDEPPIAIGEHIVKCLAMEEMDKAVREGKQGAPSSHCCDLMQNGLITVADTERILRRYLEEELNMAKQELDGGDEHDGTPSAGAEDVASKLSKLSLGSQPHSPLRSRVPLCERTDDCSYLKELSYRKLRSTTVLLEPEKDGSSPTETNNDDSSVSVASQDQYSQASNNPLPATTPNNESGLLHDLHVADCSDTHFYLLQPFEHATIAACTDCIIVLGAVVGLLHVVDCERTTITSAARRVVVSNSFDVVHYLFTPTLGQTFEPSVECLI